MSKTSIEKIREKKQMLDLLQKILSTLDSEENDTKMEYRATGKTETQKKHWKTGELLWEDEEKTIPVYETKYDYVEKEEFSEDDKAKLEAINQIRTAIEKLV